MTEREITRPTKMSPERRREALLATMGGFIAATLVISFLAQPLMRFADPEGLTVGLPFVVLGIVLSYYRFVLSGGVKRYDLIGFLALFSGVVILSATWADALAISEQTDRVCAQLEEDMLSPKPRRANAPEVFSALQCRPQRGALAAP